MFGKKTVICELSQLLGSNRFATGLADIGAFEQVITQDFAQVWPVLFQYANKRFEKFCGWVERHCTFSLVIRTSKVAEAGDVASVPGGGQHA